MPATSAAMTPIRKAIAVSRMRMVAGWWGWCSHGMSRISSRSVGRYEAIGEEDPQVCCGVGEVAVSSDLHVDLA